MSSQPVRSLPDDEPEQVFRWAHRDGVKRVETFREMSFVVKKRFGKIGCGVKVKTRHIEPQKLLFKLFGPRC